MDRGAFWATAHGVAESDMTEGKHSTAVTQPHSPTRLQQAATHMVL